MSNRFNPQSTPAQSQNFGLVGWLEETRVQLPLKGVECQFHICGDLLNVEIDQIFHQGAQQAMDCVYTFPLPAGAAVYRCEMHVNGRVIRAKVEEQARAREIAREQKAAGRRTALVEMERENLFTLSLGNLQPGDVVVIRFAYVETLTRLGDWTSLRIPFCPGVRYIPGEPLLRSLRGKGTDDDTDQVPDASRISPPRIDALHPDAAYLSVRGVIENPLELLTEISSASHPVVVTDGDRQFRVTLACGDTLPDGDFALRWTESPSAQMQSAAWSFRAGVETYALVLLQAPRVEVAAQASPQDFYFLVDRSGSMQGLKWAKAVQSFRAFLQQLSPEDRVWLTFFSDTHRDFAEKPLTVRELLADANLASLENLGADGGTELLPALRHALDVMSRHSAGRDSSIVLITDGQVGNESIIIDSLRAHPRLRVHSFGIDTAVNDALLTRLATQQRGSCCLLQPTDDIVGAVARLGARLRRPVVTSITAGDGWELPGATVPDLHSEECLSLSFKTNSADAKEVVVKGRLPDGREEMFRLPLIERAEPAIRLLWARSRIRHHLDQGQSAQALALAKATNLLCEGAAFIAWDEAEQVAIAEREIYQPSIGLRDVMDQTFGGVRFLSRSRPSNMVSEDGAFLPSHSPLAPRQRSGPPYRHDICYKSSPGSAAANELQLLLSKRPLVDAKSFNQAFAGRLAECYVRFIESYAFHDIGGQFMLLLMEWVVDGGTAVEHRMKRVEELMQRLEAEAPDLETGLVLTHQWLTKSVPATEAIHARLQATLASAARRVTGSDMLGGVLKRILRGR